MRKFAAFATKSMHISLSYPFSAAKRSLEPGTWLAKAQTISSIPARIFAFLDMDEESEQWEFNLQKESDGRAADEEGLLSVKNVSLPVLPRICHTLCFPRWWFHTDRVPAGHRRFAPMKRCCCL